MVFERGRVGTGSVLALDAVGKQDEFFHNETMADSMWDPTYTQSTNFAITQRIVPLPGSVWIDHEVALEIIPKSAGDMISNIHLKCSLPPLPPGNVYTDQLGRAIIKQVDFMIDGQVIESLNDDWYIVRDQLFLDADEKNAMAKCINGGYSEGTLSLQNNTPRIDMIIPMDFFFCRRHSRYKKHRERLDKPYFPTCALYNQKLYLKIKFQPWSWFSNSVADTRTGSMILNTPLVTYTTVTTTALNSGDSNVSVTDDITFWPEMNGEITIDSEEMTYTNKVGSTLQGLVRPDRVNHSNSAPVTLTSTSGFTFKSNVIVQPVSNCVSGMYIYGIPTLSGGSAFINSIDTANSIVNISYTNIPTSQTFPLAFSYPTVNKTLTFPSFIQANDHYTFTSNSTTGLYPGMKLVGTSVTTGKLYIKGDPVISANNINSFTAAVGSATYTDSNTVVTFTINQSVPYLTTGTSYVIFPNLATGVIQNIAGATLTANVNGLNVVSILTGFNNKITIDSPPIVDNYVTIYYPWQEPQINKFSVHTGIPNYTTSNTVVDFNITSPTVPDLTAGVSSVIFPNIATGIVQTVNGRYLTANINGQNVVSPLTNFIGDVVFNSMDIAFKEDTARIVNINYLTPIDTTTTSNVVVINERPDIKVNMAVTGLPGIVGQAVVTDITDSNYTISYPVQSSTTLDFPLGSGDSNMYINGDVSTWPFYNGSLMIGGSELAIYGSKGSGTNFVNQLTRYQKYQGIQPAGTRVSVSTLIPDANNAATILNAISNTATSITLTSTSNISNWPSTGDVLLGAVEICTYSSKVGQTLTVTRRAGAQAYDAGAKCSLISYTNSILSNLASSITNVATTITLSSNITTWPSSGSVLVGTNEICTYSSKTGQNLTVTRPTYARAYPAGTNVIFQNTYTYSTLVSNLNAKSNSFVVSAPTASVKNWPTANGVVCVDNEVLFYGNRSGNSFTNCNSRTLTWSTIPAGTPVVNMSVWQAPIVIKNLTDFVEAPRVIFEEVQLTDEERQYIKTKPRRLVVNHVVKEPPLYFEQGTNGQITLNIGANFPVTFMCWFIRRSDFESLTRYVDSRYSYGYTTKYINAATPITFFNGVKFNYIDLINSAQISLNGNPILSKLGGGVYFTMKQPFDRSLSIPTKSMYIYSFGLNPKEYNQGGFMDFSPLNSSTTTLTLEFNPAYATELAKAFSLYMFYYGYTVMEIKDGFGRLVFV
jgi:hypothetical protein